MIKTNRSLGNFSEYQFKGNYNRCCNFPNCYATSLNPNIINGTGTVGEAIIETEFPLNRSLEDED